MMPTITLQKKSNNEFFFFWNDEMCSQLWIFQENYIYYDDGWKNTHPQNPLIPILLPCKTWNTKIPLCVLHNWFSSLIIERVARRSLKQRCWKTFFRATWNKDFHTCAHWQGRRHSICMLLRNEEQIIVFIGRLTIIRRRRQNETLKAEQFIKW